MKPRRDKPYSHGWPVRDQVWVHELHNANLPIESPKQLTKAAYATRYDP